MDRISFIESISDIEYPEMLVQFFDQFIALKQLVEDHGNIKVNSKSDISISFNVLFQDQKYRDMALANTTGSVIIYNKPISVKVDIVSENELNFILQ